MDQLRSHAVSPQRRSRWAVFAIAVAFVIGIVVGFVRGE
jgi:hypothetical protein